MYCLPLFRAVVALPDTDPSINMNDPEAQLINPETRLGKDAPIEIRMGFVRKVYGILSAQLLLTVAIAAPFSFLSVDWLAGHVWVMYLAYAALIACMCVMLCCGPVLRKYPENYIFLFIFTAVMAVVVGFVSATYTWQSVLLAAGATVLIFLSLSCYAWVSKTDFTGFGPYLFAALSALCVFGLILCILSWFGVSIHWMLIVYDILGVIIFSFYIVFDTQLMLGEWGGHKVSFSIDDYAFAALNLYLDIINLFLFLLQLFGSRR
mmetsp:Transcript_27963/g.43582  ORF Transcript_27963/g.43582 Transcript_27963/m.43582 type:complete len:264 (-) Transcript_27963:75-866(-)